MVLIGFIEESSNVGNIDLQSCDITKGCPP